MEVSLSKFGTWVKDERFRTVPIILLLNKLDIFASRIKKKPIANYFPDGPTDEDYETGCRYFAQKFAELDERPCGFLTIVATSAVDREAFRKTLGTIESVITQVYKGEYKHIERGALGSGWFPSIHYQKSVEPSFSNVPQRKFSNSTSNFSSSEHNDSNSPSNLSSSNKDDLDSSSALGPRSEASDDKFINFSWPSASQAKGSLSLHRPRSTFSGEDDPDVPSASSPRNDGSNNGFINLSQPSASRAKGSLSLHESRSSSSGENDTMSRFPPPSERVTITHFENHHGA